MLDWALPPSQSATLGERHHGVGAVLPATKVTKEIEAARGVPKGEKCFSPAAHKVFHNPRELVRFIATMRELADGKPTGFKLCVGQSSTRSKPTT